MCDVMEKYLEEERTKARAQGQEEGAFNILVMLVQQKIISVKDAAVQIGMGTEEFQKKMLAKINNMSETETTKKINILDYLDNPSMYLRLRERFEEGYKEGLKEVMVLFARQNLIAKEVAAEKLGMSAEEFQKILEG